MSRHTERPAATSRPVTAEHPAAAIARRTSALVRATDAAQESISLRTGQLQKEAAHQLRLATSPAEMMAVQAAMLMAGWQHSVQCAADMASAWFSVGMAGGLPKRTGDVRQQ